MQQIRQEQLQEVQRRAIKLIWGYEDLSSEESKMVGRPIKRSISTVYMYVIVLHAM